MDGLNYRSLTMKKKCTRPLHDGGMVTWSSAMQRSVERAALIGRIHRSVPMPAPSAANVRLRPGYPPRLEPSRWSI